MSPRQEGRGRHQRLHRHHDRFWVEARRRKGDRDGTTALIEVLLLHRSVAGEAVVLGWNGR